MTERRALRSPGDETPRDPHRAADAYAVARGVQDGRMTERQADATAPLWRLAGIRLIAPRSAPSPKEKAWPLQVGQAIGGLAGNYNDMREANTVDADKYFHCKGNCEAARAGTVGDWVAGHISNGREIYGQRVKGDPRSDMLADQRANRAGRIGAREQGRSCSEICAHLRPRGLSSEY